ncbi:MAG: hypothetical protein WCW33_04300 [Candidatus Babeliales bacterium]
MKIFNIKNVFTVALGLSLSLQSGYAALAPLQQREPILFSAGKDSELLERFALRDERVGAFLCHFLRDQDVSELFFKLPRNIALLGHWIRTPALRQSKATYIMQKVQGAMALERQLIDRIVERYNITILSVGSSYVFVFNGLRFSDSNRNVLIKVPRVLYPLLPDIRQVINTTDSYEKVVECASSFQLLSRLVYYQKMHDVIAEIGLTHIRLPRKFLFPRPIDTTYEFSLADIVNENFAIMTEEFAHDVVDNNYILVEEYIPNPHSVPGTWEHFAALDVTPLGQEIFTEMEIVIQACGLWSLFPDQVDRNGFHTPNVFLVENDTAVAFVDLEKPGFGDPDERDVAEYNEARLFHPRDDGMKQLAMIRSGLLAIPQI